MTQPRFARSALLFVPVALLFLAADWPQFRGPDSSATSPDTGHPVTWSSGENVVWKTDLPGFGASSPITSGQKIFVTCYSGYGQGQANVGSQDQLKRHVLCLEDRKR